MDTNSDSSSLNPHFFLVETKGSETLETQGFDSIENNISTISHPPIGSLRNYFSWDITRSPFPQATSEDIEFASLISTVKSV